jgi:hypothetical protein
MTAQKRTMTSEMHEFFAEIRDRWRQWRAGRRPSRTAPKAHITVETLPDELAEISFTPIELEAETGQRTGAIGRAARGASVPAANVCPITRQTLYPAGKIYRCRQCGISYSPEGWDFLRQTSKGECCGCHNVNTVLPVVRAREA